LGSALHLLRDPLDYARRCAHTYGDVVQIGFLGQRTILVSHPEDIRTVLHTQQRNFRKPAFHRGFSALLGRGLIISDGAHWRRQRTMVNPALHGPRLAEYGTIALSAVESLIHRWSPGGPRDLHADFMKLSLEVIARSLFGTELFAEEIVQLLDAVLRHYLSITRYALPDGIPSPGSIRTRNALRRLDELLARIIEGRRASRTSGSDILGSLLEARDSSGHAMSDRDLRDEIVTLLLAGHETAALVLTYTTHLLARHPEIAGRFAAESDALGRIPSPADLPKLPFAIQVVHESMRLYPPAWGISRESIAPCRIGGHAIPGGAQISMLPWIVHRDRRWFPHPERFDPERWSESGAKSLHRFAYFPFGHGPRICAGNEFAMTEIVLILARLSQRFRWRLLDARPLRFAPSITLRPKRPVYVEVLPRT